LRDFLELAVERVSEAIARHEGARERLHAFVLECLRIYAEYRINHAALFSEMNMLSAEQRDELRAVGRTYAHVLRDLILAVNPEVDRGRHQTMALTMIAFGAVNWTYTWFDAKGPLSLDDVAGLTTKLLLNGLESI
jgi:Tetracyclin repressor-like, C-terminal domain